MLKPNLRKADTEQLLNIILEKRKQALEPMRMVKERLSRLIRSVRPLTEKMQQASLIAEEKEKLSLTSVEASIKKLIHRSEKVIESLCELEKRFSRESLRLVVVGFSRQGKSTFLQLVTGLTSREIPSGGGGDCTDVPCFIHHFDGTPYAELAFHSKQSLFDHVVVPFFRVLFPQETPLSLDDFLSMDIPELPDAGVEHLDLRKRLVLLREHFDEYSDELTGETSRRIALDDIRQYVAKTDDRGLQIGWKHLAVVEARIYCPFGSHGLRQLCVVDCKGYSSIEPRASERISDIISEEADAILVIRCPKAMGDEFNRFDAQFHDTLQRALGKRRFGDIGFYLFNAISNGQSNKDLCTQMRAQTQDKAVEVFVSDCTQDSVIEDVIDPILQHLARNLPDLDRDSLEPIHVELQAIVAELIEQIEVASVITSRETSIEDGFPLECRIAETLNSMRQSLLSMVHGVVGKRQQIHDKVLSQFDQLIESMEKEQGLPSLTEFQSLSASEGIDRTFLFFRDTIRSRIQGTKGTMDKSFSRLFEEVQYDIQQVFQRIGLVERLGIETNERWWDTLAEQFEGQQSERQEIAEMVRQFGKEKFSTSTLLEHKLSEGLQPLAINNQTYIPYEIVPKDRRRIVQLVLKGEIKSLSTAFEHRLVSEQEAIEILKAAHKKTVDEFRKNIPELIDTIQRQLFETVKNFIDKTSNFVHNKVWEAFYRDRARLFFPEILEQRDKMRLSFDQLQAHISFLCPEIRPEDFELVRRK